MAPRLRSGLFLASLVSSTLCGSMVSCSAQELNWAEKMFERLNVDFGVVARGAECKQQLKVRNLYQEPIFVTNVSTSCGCSAAKPSANQIASGQEVFIEITMDTTRFMREKTSSVLVTVNEPTKGGTKEVKIPLRVYIRTDVVFQPGSVNFGAVDAGAGSKRKISVAYAGRSDWKIKEVKSPKPYLSATPVETSRSANGTVNYDLEVALAPDAPVGLLRDQLTLVTDDQANPHVPLAVEARVEAEFSIEPQPVAFGAVPAGQTKTLNFVIRGKKPFRIEKLEAGSLSGQFTVQLPTDEKKIHLLPLRFTAPMEAAAIDEPFTVIIAGRPEPLTFKVTAKVTVAAPTPATK